LTLQGLLYNLHKNYEKTFFFLFGHLGLGITFGSFVLDHSWVFAPKDGFGLILVQFNFTKVVNLVFVPVIENESQQTPFSGANTYCKWCPAFIIKQICCVIIRDLICALLHALLCCVYENWNWKRAFP